MPKTLALLALLTAFAGAALSSAALAHGGKTHRLMGTVASVDENQLTLTTTEGEQASVRLTAETTYEKERKPVDRSALVAGARVVVELDESDEVAVKVRIGGGEPHHH